MALTAVQISPYALEGLRAPLMGHVHSVFNTSFNVELDGALVHVGRPRMLRSYQQQLHKL